MKLLNASVTVDTGNIRKLKNNHIEFDVFIDLFTDGTLKKRSVSVKIRFGKMVGDAIAESFLKTYEVDFSPKDNIIFLGRIIQNKHIKIKDLTASYEGKGLYGVIFEVETEDFGITEKKIGLNYFEII